MKLLLASTALLSLSSGLAMAEISLSGSARMGIIDDFGDDNTGFTSRARVVFTLSGESDTGLAFGATFRADNAVGANSGTAGEVYVSTGNFRFSMGDVDGAAQTAAGQVDGVGLTGLSDLNEIAYLGTGGASGLFLDADFFAALPTATAINGDPTALVQYSAGNLTIYASITQPSYTFTEPCCTWTNGDTYSIAAAYTMDGYKFSIGYEKWDGDRTTIVSTASVDNLVLGADATFGAFTMKARYSEGSTDFDGTAFQDHKQWAVSGTYKADALSLTAYISDMSADQSGTIVAEREAYGLGAAYDLGGGASVVGGYAKNKTDDTNAFDLGLSFAF